MPHLSALAVSSILLIKSFKVLYFHCLKRNSFIILSAPIFLQLANVLSSLVNGRVIILAPATSAMMSHRILITADYLNTHVLSVIIFVYALQALKVPPCVFGQINTLLSSLSLTPKHPKLPTSF